MVLIHPAIRSHGGKLARQPTGEVPTDQRDRPPTDEAAHHHEAVHRQELLDKKNVRQAVLVAYPRGLPTR